jgi:hypothetical protein
MRKLHAIYTLCFLLGLLACSSSSDPAGPGGSNPGDFDAVIATGGEFEEVTPVDEILDEETVVDTVGNEQFFCTTTTYNIVEAPESFPQFDPNAEVIYPGNLLQGASLGQATPNPIPVGRGPGTVVMTILNGSPAVSVDVPIVSLASMTQAQNDIISTASNTVPARFSFVTERVRSYEEFALSLDMNVHNVTVDVNAALDFHTDFEYNRFMVKLVQSYFTMAFEIPTSVEEFFSSSVTPADLDPFIGPGNPPAFISSVTYGRIFYLLIESTATSTEIEASVDASFNAAVSGGSISVGAEYLSELENVKISAFALGGDSENAINAITDNFDSLKSFLATGGNINTGVPLSYVVRSVANRDKIVSVAVATEYDVTECVPVGESFENPIFWYKGDQGISKDGSNHITKWANSFADPSMDATPLDGMSTGGLYRANILNGKPVVRFGGGSGSFGDALRFPGVDFTASDWTVVAVARTVSAAMDYPSFFLFGSGVNARSDLSVGFRNPVQVTMTHDEPTLNAPVPQALTSFQVYVFRFSQAEGMTIWAGGGAQPVAANPANTAALLDYIGARMGSSNGALLEIAEIKAYAQAIDDAQRQWIIDDLLVKYAL